MGHENVGTIAKAGRDVRRAAGLGEGDRVFVEHYVGCYRCEWCRSGEYRHCEATDWRTNPDARRYGYTSSRATRTTCGAASRSTCTCPGTRCCTRCPTASRPELAGIVTPLSNGIEWALVRRGVGFMSTVLIQGPGQQGLSQVVACKQAGALADHRHRHLARRAPGSSWRKTLGADHTIDVQEEDPLERGAGDHRRRRASTSCSTAPPAPARRRCCSASTRSSAAPARCSSRASWRRSRTSRSSS